MTGSVSAVHTGQGADGPLTLITSKVRLHEKKKESPNLKGGPKETGSISTDKEGRETHRGSCLLSKKPGSLRIQRIHFSDPIFTAVAMDPSCSSSPVRELRKYGHQ